MSYYILGGGVTGLSAGLSSGLPVFEAAEGPGGICSSYYVSPSSQQRLAYSPAQDNAYRFEIGGAGSSRALPIRCAMASMPGTDKIHLFPSGVEIAHFAQAADPVAFPRPVELAQLTGPILGYFGVIDERMDLALLADLAQSHPHWQLVMVGPVIKIAPHDLPQASNLHYVGMKDYGELPAYLAHFAVALVPFAINESTRYLSPTKTLEYLAAHKPVVATPIPDIVALYGDYVRIGCTPPEFAAQVEAALAESPAQQARRQPKEQALLQQYTWDHIAQRMQEIRVKAATSHWYTISLSH